MTFLRKWRFPILIGSGLIAAGMLFYFSNAHVNSDKTQGAIGKRDVYRDAQVSSADVATPVAIGESGGAFVIRVSHKVLCAWAADRNAPLQVARLDGQGFIVVLEQDPTLFRYPLRNGGIAIPGAKLRRPSP